MTKDLRTQKESERIIISVNKVIHFMCSSSSSTYIFFEYFLFKS
jgi:hypothetical protein